MTLMIVGLGNPGPEYEHTRHNAGFMTINLLGENLRAAYWKDEAGAKTAVVRFGEDDLVLAKPQTFVNLSGAAVKNLLEAYDAPLSALIVIHDDIDLPPAVVRVKRGGGTGPLPLNPDLVRDEPDGVDVLALDEILKKLETKAPRQAEIVELRYFAGLSVVEVAGALGISPRTVDTDWRLARAWLYRELSGTTWDAAT